MSSLLTVDNVSVRFGGITALTDVSFQVGVGETVALIGPNGAGKTTMINAISGLIAPNSGTIVLRGSELHRLLPHQVARAGVGRAFQHAELLGDETVLENLVTGSDFRHATSFLDCVLGTPRLRRNERQARGEAEALLERFALLPFAGIRARELPFGLAKKVDVARALMARPQLLLLDEPTSGLSEAEADELITACFEVASAEGTTVFLIEHNLRVVMSAAQRLVVLDYGRKIADGPPVEVTADPAVLTAYLGEEDDVA